MKEKLLKNREEGSAPEEKIRSRDLYIRPHKEKKPGKIYGLLFIALCIAGFFFLLRKDAEERPEPDLRTETNEEIMEVIPEEKPEITIPSYSQNPGQAQVTYERYEINSIVYEVRGAAAYVVGTVGNSKSVKYLTVEQTVMFSYPVVEICEEAFRDCTKLLKIHIPDSVIILGDRAFYNCERLEKVRLSEKLVTVGAQAFAYCTSLQTLTVPSSVKELTADVFEGDKALLKVTLPSACRIPSGDDPFRMGEQLVLDWY